MKLYHKYAIDTEKDIAISQVLQELAFANGYKWFGTAEGKLVRNLESNILFFYPFDKTITHSTSYTESAECKALSHIDCIRLLIGTLDNHTSMKIADYSVEVVPGEHIKFGCTTIKSADVKKLIAAWNLP